MKKFLFVLFVSPLMFSCSKSEVADDPSVKAFSGFINRYLICDSIRVTANGLTGKQILGKGKGFDMRFNGYGSYTQYSNPDIINNYQFAVPNKIYYWKETYDANQFFTINSMTANNIALQNNEQGTTIVRYFTAE